MGRKLLADPSALSGAEAADRRSSSSGEFGERKPGESRERPQRYPSSVVDVAGLVAKLFESLGKADLNVRRRAGNLVRDACDISVVQVPKLNHSAVVWTELVEQPADEVGHVVLIGAAVRCRWQVCCDGQPGSLVGQVDRDGRCRLPSLQCLLQGAHPPRWAASSERVGSRASFWVNPSRAAATMPRLRSVRAVPVMENGTDAGWSHQDAGQPSTFSNGTITGPPGRLAV